MSTATQTAPIQDELLQSFRTREANPEKHNIEHLNRFYTVPSEEIKSIFCHGLPAKYQKQTKTFAEMCILIRKPALEILSCLAQTDYSKPVNKYVICILFH